MPGVSSIITIREDFFVYGALPACGLSRALRRCIGLLIIPFSTTAGKVHCFRNYTRHV